LRSANNVLIDYHYDLPLSHLWGGGMLSSSDGQRFPAAAFGYEDSHPKRAALKVLYVKLVLYPVTLVMGKG